MNKLLISALLLAFQGDGPPKNPIHFTCTSPISPTLRVELDLDRDPLEALRMIISNVTPATTDTVPPVIQSVNYSGGSTVLDDKVKIPGSSASIQFAVAGTDDIGVQSFALYVDNLLVSAGNGGAHLLAKNGVTFAVRWNDGEIPAGWHDFKLTIYDKGGNASEAKTWRMVKP